MKLTTKNVQNALNVYYEIEETAKDLAEKYIRENDLSESYLELETVLIYPDSITFCSFDERVSHLEFSMPMEWLLKNQPLSL